MSLEIGLLIIAKAAKTQGYLVKLVNVTTSCYMFTIALSMQLTLITRMNGLHHSIPPLKNIHKRLVLCLNFRIKLFPIPHIIKELGHFLLLSLTIYP